MNIAWIVLSLAAQDQQQDSEELRRRIAEKRLEIQERREDLARLDRELDVLRKDFLGSGRFLVATEAQALYTHWDNDLQLDNSGGFGFRIIPGWSGLTHNDPPERNPEKPERYMEYHGGLPLSVRLWRADDERTGDDVEIISCHFVGLAARGFVLGSKWGYGMVFSGGFTRFNGEDADTGPSFSSEVEVKFKPEPWLMLGAGLSWDAVKTSYNERHTHTRQALSALLSLEVSF